MIIIYIHNEVNFPQEIRIGLMINSIHAGDTNRVRIDASIMGMYGLYHSTAKMFKSNLSKMKKTKAKPEQMYLSDEKGNTILLVLLEFHSDETKLKQQKILGLS